VPPEPYIESIDHTGKAKIRFSSAINTVPNLTMINNGTVEVDGEVYPVLQIDVEPGMDSFIKDLRFEYNVTAQDEFSIDVQLYFKKAIFVSSNNVSQLLFPYSHILFFILGR